MTLIYDTTRAGGGDFPGGGGGVLQILPKITQTQNVPNNKYATTLDKELVGIFACCCFTTFYYQPFYMKN